MSARHFYCLPVGFWLLLAGVVSAETITVYADGSGDAPTILAAIEAAASSGDVIELADGVFSGPGNRDLTSSGKSILIRSMSGEPLACIIDAGGSADQFHRGILFEEDG